MAKNETGVLVIGLAEYYDKILTECQLDMYVEDLKDLSLQDLDRAIKIYRNDPDNKWFPLPAVLKSMLRPRDEDTAREVSGRIREAISRFGPYRLGEAKLFIGEIGWSVVTRFGGWGEINKIEDDMLPTLQAQWRDLAKSMINRDRKGIRDEAPRFESTHKAELENLSKLKGMIKLPTQSS